MQIQKTWLAALLFCLCLLCLAASPAQAATEQQIDEALEDISAYILRQTPSPQVGSIGGEWAVLGLARSGAAVPSNYFSNYYNTVSKHVQDCAGVLHSRKYTEYSRVILGLTAAGYDARNVAGYDLTKPLADYEKTVWQGLNGPIFALIALDSGDYPMATAPAGATQASRESYVSYILARQLPDGGFSLSGEEPSDPDMTAMALQALSNYQSATGVSSAIEKALACLSAQQDGEGGYSSWGTKNCESTAQVIVALGELGISMEDSRFVKNGKTLADALLSYYSKGQGFSHSAELSGNDAMSTEQGLYALAALKRAASGQSSLYDMADSGKNNTTSPAAAFNDIAGHKYADKITALAEGAFISGMGDGSFQPDRTLTRAEFATLISKALGLSGQSVSVFTDVQAGDWFAPYVGAAYRYGMITGRTARTFDPQGTITDKEALLILDRVAVKLGARAAVTAQWAPSSVRITRGETASLLYDLLREAKKL